MYIGGYIDALVSTTIVVILATVPFMAAAGGIMGYFITKYTTRAQDSYADAGSVAEQVFSGIRTVYSFSLQKRFSDLYEKKLEVAKKHGIIRGLCLGIGFGGFM